MSKNSKRMVGEFLNRLKIFDVTDVVSSWWKNQSGPARAGFLSALIIGFVSHLFIYTGRYYNREDMGAIFRVQPVFGSGRWFNTVISILSYGYIIPLVTGIFVTLFLAVSTFLICKLFTIQKTFNGILIGGLLSTFPSVANTNLFLWDSANYHFGVLLAVLAVYVTVHYRRGVLAGGFLTMLTLAIYQAKLNVILALCLFYLILGLLDDKIAFKRIGETARNFLLMIGSGGILYAVSVPISFYFTNTTFNNYKGFSYDSMLTRWTSLRTLIHNLGATYLHFKDSIFGNIYLTVKALQGIYLLIIVLSVLFFIAIVRQTKLSKRWLRFLAVMILVLLIPFACNFSDFLDVGIIYGVMTYAFVMVLVFAVVIGERCQNVFPIFKSIFTLCMILVIGNYIVGNNVYYLKAYYFNQRTESITTRVLAMLDPFLAKVDSKRVALFGSLPNEYYPGSSEMFVEYGVIEEGASLQNNTYIGYKDSRINSKFVANANLNHGLQLTSVGDEDTAEKRRLAKAILDMNMPTWPEEDCVRIIDGVIVVNFGLTDVVLEEMDGNRYFLARHYVGVGHVGHSYEYHWLIYQNDDLLDEFVTASPRLAADMIKADGTVSVTVSVTNTKVGFRYPEVSVEVNR